jgi:hypothetical protein
VLYATLIAKEFAIIIRALLNMKRLALLYVLLCCARPAHAIVVTAGTDPNSVVIPGDHDVFGSLSLSGVVMVTTSNGSCSGALIGDFTVLTAGHCMEAAIGTGLYSHPQVAFLPPTNTGGGAGGQDILDVSSIAVDPSWNGDPTLGGDLAVLHLSQAAPAYATRYSLYTGMALPTSSSVVLAGFGLSGTGATGANGYGYGYLRAGTNEYAVTGADPLFDWSSNMLIGQFYDVNNPSTNALGLLNPYSSSNEVIIAPGDSGGPTFYNGQIIGVHDVIICLSPPNSQTCSVPPSVSPYDDSFYGELWGDVSVAGNAAFIDGSVAPEPGSAMLTILGLSLAAWRRLRHRGN